MWKTASGMSMMRQKYIINTIYDKHWHGQNLAPLDLPDANTYSV